MRQYIFALIGDMQKHMGDIMKAHIPQIIEAGIKNLNYDPDESSLPNSAMYGT